MSFRLLPLALALAAALISVDAGKSCETNEEYKTCGPSIEPTCDNHEQHLPMDKKCNVGCFCKEDYVRDAHGNCIPKKSCPIPCPDNSAYSPHGGSQATCLKPRPVTSTKPGCYCNPKFVLDSTTNTCIPWQKCPCFGQNQIYSDCVPIYPKTCSHRSNSKKHDMCLENWKACICKDGYALNDDKVCVPFKECPPTPCEVKCAKKGNEKYVACVNDIRCDLTSVDTECKHGCQCIKGYARDKSGKCIPLQHCPCQGNATFALGVSACPPTCETLTGPHCMAIKQAGCECNAGYVLNSKKECILIEDCDAPKKCPARQEFTKSSVQHYCNQPDVTIQNGCVCCDGLWYDENTKTCVKPGQCSCPGNLVYTDSCTLDFCGAGTESITNKCACPKGMSYDLKLKICVLTKDCTKVPLPTCPKGQQYFAVRYQLFCNQPAVFIYNDCGCPTGKWYDEYAKACVDAGQCSCPGNLVYTTSGTMDYCGLSSVEVSNTCVCPKGTSYDLKLQTCVKTKDCSGTTPPKCPATQGYHSVSYQLYCNQPGSFIYNDCGCLNGQWYDERKETCVDPGHCSCPANLVYILSGSLDYCGIGSVAITHQCGCPKGMSYDIKSESCVLTVECTKPTKPTCPVGQVFSAVTYQLFCNQAPVFIYNDCACPNGQWYDEYAGKCVNPGQCSCPGNMVYTTSGFLYYCGLGTEAISYKCACPKGMSYDITSKTCVPTAHCATPPKPSCPSGQAYFAMTYQKFCHQEGVLIYNDCGCLNGNWYDEYAGTCVAPGQCSCPGNMVYTQSGVLDYCGACTEKLNNKCGCRKGMSYDIKAKTCVKKSDCTVVTQPTCPSGQTYFAMTYQKYCTKPATFIYNTCGCLNGKWYNEITKSCVNPSECKCPSNLIWVQEGILKLCNKKEKLIHNGCVCPVDLFYDTTLEKCVTAKSCTGGPTTPTKDQLCKEHDPLTEYRSCQSSSCVLRCDNLNPIACTADCMSGCFCQKHLVQVSHKNKTCVAPKDCPSKPIEKECSTTMVFTNEGRLYYCGNKDSDYKKNDCVCPPGYRYDRIKKICVEPCDCSYSDQDWECFKKDPNTEYYDCKSNTCLPTCQSQYPDYCNKKCTTGCHCKPGLMQVSETNTSCVVPSECPKGNCCIQSTYTDKCTVNKRCDNMFLSFSQALCDGVKRCVCNDGYVMNSKQECVLPQECKPEEIRCPQNMEYSTCHGCEKQCDNLNPICTEECRIGCFCIEGYALNAEKVCVPIKDCPAKCPENEEHKPCKSLNPDTCRNFLINPKPKIHKEICIAGCDCKSGFVRNDNQTCVSPSQCPPPEFKCGVNMVYTGKKYSCAICPSTTKPKFTMKEGCDCNDNLVFDSTTGECVDKTMCTESKENKDCKDLDPNTKFSTCQACPRTCCNRHPICNMMCTPGCECLSGYVKSSPTGKCIPETSCPMVDPVVCSGNTTYQECAFNQKCVNANCQLPVPEICKAGCGCREGYLEASNGNCVLPTDCDVKIDCKEKDPNSEFLLCGTCRRTCADKTPVCDKKCHIGCFCKKGYVLDKTDGKCIVEKKCPKVEPDSKPHKKDSSSKHKSKPKHDDSKKDKSKPKKDNSKKDKSKPKKDDSKKDKSKPKKDDSKKDPSKPKHDDSKKDKSKPKKDDSKKDPSKPKHDDPKKDKSKPKKDDSKKDPSKPKDDPPKKDKSKPKKDDSKKDPSKPKHNDSKKDKSKPKKDTSSKDPTKPKHDDSKKDKSKPKKDDSKKDPAKPKHDDSKKDPSKPKDDNPKKDKSKPKKDDSKKDPSKPKDDNPKKDKSKPKKDDSKKDPSKPKHDDSKKDKSKPKKDDSKKDPSKPKHDDSKKDKSKPKKDDSKKDKSKPKKDDSKKDKSKPKKDDSKKDPAKPKHDDSKKDKSKPKKDDSKKDKSKPKHDGSGSTSSKDALCKKQDPNTEYRTRQSSSCVLTCDNLNLRACTDDYISGCFCQKHLVQVSYTNKTCVAPADCPIKPPTKTCPKTKIFTDEGRLYYCGNKNSDYKKNDCICPPGYRYDRIKSVCVEPCDCSYSDVDLECYKKDPNTEYYDCKSDKCVPTCESQYPDYCNKKCTVGCHCKQGLLQISEKNATCVLPTQCPQPECCLHSTYTDKCIESKRCDNMYLNFAQALCDGVKRCVCNDGYVMNSKQECVLPQECKPEEIRCPQNMEYSTCHTCEKQCDNLDPVCTKECKVGCFCIKDHALNAENVCVPIKDCPAKCPANEEHKQCKSLTPATCSNLLIDPKPKICKEVCVAGCDCKSGFVRNEKQVCVEPSKCPQTELKCGVNMVYTGTKSKCSTCPATGKPIFTMKDGCDCVDNLVFDTVTGQCVDRSMCTESKENKDCLKADPNTKFSTCKACPRTCCNRHPICNMMCTPGCECKSGYVISSTTGKCIPETSCPIISPVVCPGNTTYQECAFNQQCSKTSCQSAIPKNCKPGCACRDGYLENANGNCVLPADCDSKINCSGLDPNSEFSLCGTCRRSCDDKSPICDAKCHIGCFCKKGYVLDKPDGKCIPEKSCPTKPKHDDSKKDKSKPKKDDSKKDKSKPKKDDSKKNPSKPKHDDSKKDKSKPKKDDSKKDKSKPKHDGSGSTSSKDALCKKQDPNTEYRTRQSSSCVLTCDNLNLRACTDDYISGCFCQKHLVQVSYTNRTCIAPADCPSKPPVKTCPKTMILTDEGRLYYCGNKNSDYKKNNCVCPPGYRYDRIKSICVEPCDCSYSDADLECYKKDPNTEYYDCKSDKCVPTCESQYPDYCNKKCTVGCHCKQGLLQISEKNATCVLPSQCPQPQCCQHSTYTDKCIESKRCDNMYLNFAQALCDGVKRCVCNPGYVMNSKQECVLPQECKPEEIRCPQNMEYSTCHTCEKQCDNLDPVCTKECKVGCFCIKDHALNSENVCVPIKDCPAKCPANEEHKQCKSLTPATCSNLLINPKPKICKEVCIAGCDCKSGFVRNEKQVCVEPSKCPQTELKCGVNMVYTGTKSKCSTCPSTGKPTFTLKDGCDCVDNLVFDTATGQCVDKSMCTESKENKDCIKADPNTKFSTCKACPRTCCNRHPICNAMCTPGCECKSGYVISSTTGKCIPETSCPVINPVVCPGNTTYQECAFNQKCSKTSCQSAIPKNCKPGCACRDGYLENANGDCVLPANCDSKINCNGLDPNSEFSVCGTCRRICDDKTPICDAKCHIGCFCKKGYVLDKPDGKCILEKSCPTKPKNDDPKKDKSKPKKDDSKKDKSKPKKEDPKDDKSKPKKDDSKKDPSKPKHDDPKKDKSKPKKDDSKNDPSKPKHDDPKNDKSKPKKEDSKNGKPKKDDSKKDPSKPKHDDPKKDKSKPKNDDPKKDKSEPKKDDSKKNPPKKDDSKKKDPTKPKTDDPKKDKSNPKKDDSKNGKPTHDDPKKDKSKPKNEDPKKDKSKPRKDDPSPPKKDDSKKNPSKKDDSKKKDSSKPKTDDPKKDKSKPKNGDSKKDKSKPKKDDPSPPKKDDPKKDPAPPKKDDSKKKDPSKPKTDDPKKDKSKPKGDDSKKDLSKPKKDDPKKDPSPPKKDDSKKKDMSKTKHDDDGKKNTSKQKNDDMNKKDKPTNKNDDPKKDKSKGKNDNSDKKDKP